MERKMALHLKAVATPSPDHEARSKLAQAIAARDDLQRRITALASAEDSAMRESWELAAQLEKGRARLGEAEQRAADSAVERVMGRSPISGESRAEVAQALAIIADSAEATARARTILKDKLGKARSDFEFAKSHARSALEDVVWASPKVHQVLADLQTAQKTALELRSVIGELGPMPNEFLCLVATNPEFDRSAAARWRQALVLLADHADAELPS
jgi:chromosome segregation ATPase